MPAALLRLWKFEHVRLLSRLFSEYVSQALYPTSCDELLLVPVPCSPGWRRKRGYDPILDVARLLCERGYHWLPLIRRLEQDQRQLKHQDSQGRDRTARKIYRLDEGSLAQYSGRARIILLDDIMTTGATIRACYEQLEGSVEGEIEAVVVLMD